MAEVVKISIPQDVITIEVNDNGDTIILPVSDERFTKKMLDFVNHIQKKSEDTSMIPDDADLLEKVTADLDFHETLKDEFNILFGDGAYEKVYGADILVGTEYVLEFIEKCLPLIQKHTDSRVEKFKKYNANRVGSSL